MVPLTGIELVTFALRMLNKLYLFALIDVLLLALKPCKYYPS